MEVGLLRWAVVVFISCTATAGYRHPSWLPDNFMDFIEPTELTRSTDLAQYSETIQLLGTTLDCSSGSEREILEHTVYALSLPKNQLSCDIIRAVILSILASNPEYTPQHVISIIHKNRNELRELVEALISKRKSRRWMLIPLLGISIPTILILALKAREAWKTQEQIVNDTSKTTQNLDYTVQTFGNRVDNVESQVATTNTKTSLLDSRVSNVENHLENGANSNQSFLKKLYVDDEKDQQYDTNHHTDDDTNQPPPSSASSETTQQQDPSSELSTG